MIRAGELHRLWRALPFGTLDDVIGDGTCLIIAPHPDDESLGCGGLIAACCAAGRPPVVAVLTDGSGSHPNSRLYPPSRLAALREAEVTQAVRMLGLPAERLILLRELDTRAPSDGAPFDALVARLAQRAAAARCSSIMATWQHDPHCDHQAAARLGQATARACGIRHLGYPVWGWMLDDDQPIEETTVRGWRFDIGAHLPAKRRAIAAHASQHGQVILDDTQGFGLPNTLLRILDEPVETFLVT